ncbi:MAG: DUF4855 domain-containing protein [Bacteroidales bacterium]|nr:DUF4855 domain-containing protein [Bacteroidales bacterium]
MRLHLGITVFLILGIASCNPGDKETVHTPGLRIETVETASRSASFLVRTIYAERILYGISSEGNPQLDRCAETGSSLTASFTLTVDDLSSDTDYIISAMAVGSGDMHSSVQTLEFRTSSGAAALNPWESERSGVPSFADISLVTLGWHNPNPPAWTPERFSSHVEFTDPAGKGHWLFDAFLCIDGWDPVRGLSYSIVAGRESATKESWQDLLDAWLGEDGALKQLDAAVSSAAGRLGEPPSPRYVVMGMPDPIRFQQFSNPESSTTYWGSLDGKQLDFANTHDQAEAYIWYMNECRKRFRESGFGHLELAGFYILSEELPLNPQFFRTAGESCRNGMDDWNWQNKNWEIIVPLVADYAHSCNEGLWWIPYHLAPGYKVWKNLGFDAAFMQPNYYWDHDSVSHPLSATKTALASYRMGIELEFEYSLVASVMADGRSAPDGNGTPYFYAKDVPLLRNRVREYMQSFKDTSLYGLLPIAVYSGTDAWNQLATSTEQGDIDMFREICSFIYESPLKKH